MLRYICLATPVALGLLCVPTAVRAQGFYTSGIWGLPLGGYRYATPGYGYGYSTSAFREPRHVGYAFAAPAYGAATYGTAYYGVGYTAGYGAGYYGSYGAGCYGSSYASGGCYGSGYGAGCLGRIPSTG